MRDVAARLGVDPGTVTNWINRGLMKARRGRSNRWCVPFGPDAEAAWRERVAASPQVHRDIDPAGQEPSERTIAEVARALGVKPDVVYYWTERGHVPWRRGRGGRKYIHFTPEVAAVCRRRIAASVHLPAVVKSQAQQAPTGGAV